MNKFFIILFFFITLSQQLSHAQVFQDIGNDFNEFISTGIDLSSDFIKFDKSTQLNLAGSALLIGAGYSVDNNIKSFSQKNLSAFNDGLFSIDKYYGSGYTFVGIGGLYGYGLLFRNETVRKIGLQTIEAVGYSGIITSIVKSIAGRSRPYTNDGKAKFHPIDFSAAHTSLPSGHSTTAFAVSAVLANNTNSQYLKIFYYSASTLVSCARLYHNDHWFSDVIAGSLLGYFTGNCVSNKESMQKSADNGILINLSLTGINLSLAL